MKTSTILLIDEDVRFLEAAAKRLSKLGYRVKRARSAEEARELVTLLRPSFILVDRGLPGDGAAGRRILATLRQDPDTSTIPVFMTATRREMAAQTRDDA